MRTRTILVDPIHRAIIAALNEMANDRRFFSTLPPVDLERVLLTSLVQAGANRIELGSNIKDDDRLPPFLRRRIRYGASRDWAEIVAHVVHALPRGIPTNRMQDNVTLAFLPFYLVTVLRAGKRRMDSVWTSTAPDPDACRRLLPPELGLPIASILSSMKRYSLALPVPKAMVAVSDIERFRDIMTSDSFRAYESSHSELQHSAPSPWLQRIRVAAKSLRARFPQLLTLRSTTISILPVTAKLIDAAFGKLPGTLASISTDILHRQLRDKRRIVIYELKHVQDQVFQARLQELARHKVADAVP